MSDFSDVLFPEEDDRNSPDSADSEVDLDALWWNSSSDLDDPYSDAVEFIGDDPDGDYPTEVWSALPDELIDERDVPPLDGYDELIVQGQDLIEQTQTMDKAFVMADLEIQGALQAAGMEPAISGENSALQGFDPNAYRDGTYDPKTNAFFVVTVQQENPDTPEAALLGVLKFTRDEANALQVGFYPVGAGTYTEMQTEGQRLDAIFKEQGLEAGKEQARAMNEGLMQSQVIEDTPEVAPELAEPAPSFSGPSLY